jgi:hypothetical protein
VGEASYRPRYWDSEVGRMSEAGDQFVKEHPGCFLTMMGVLALVVGYFVFASGDSDGPSDAGAIDVCHQAVEEQLKAPGTADFGGETVTNVGDRYTVIGHVDAENGFGAQLRSEWACDATWVSGTEWRPVHAVVIEG